ncbi:hypothetical protein Val02_55390 [Virgisporangium aliadipatigenens]|uniref:Uncharacterized protein n=2 Tax=Virgisporangium aliadipatigenens TaxID=741659 RepID=A0A8J3YRZ4_9ACTN|nr:hypothetical protein Val02_55390 [Virgisporangium aliadipatigenens]
MVAGALAGLASIGATTAAATTVVRRERTFLPRGHAARVDTRRDPVDVALRYGCAGLTVGIAVDAQRRVVLAGPSGRFLRQHVLEPLAERVRRRGRVHAAQHEAFGVVLEADPNAGADLLDRLEDALVPYADLLSAVTGGALRHGHVQIMLAGAHRRALEARADRLFFAEGTLNDVGRDVPTDVVPVVAEHVAWRIGWDGRGEIAAEERYLLRSLMRAAHLEGKRVRFYGVPTGHRIRRAFWTELHSAGADLISAENLGALRRFLRGRHAHRTTYGPAPGQLWLPERKVRANDRPARR